MSEIRIETLGCRLNQIESEAAARFFLEQGFTVDLSAVTAQSEQDLQTLLCIINTCTVTQKAEQKARRLLRLMLKKFPNACFVVTGCYAQLSPAEIEAIDKRVCVVGGQIKSRIAKIPTLLKIESNFNAEVFAKKIKSEIALPSPEKQGFPENSFDFSTSSFLAHSRASLKIQDGCNNNCSYCAIHIARGHSVSIPVKTAIARVQELEAIGHSEVVLTTINIGQYKGEYNGSYCNFAQLLRLLLANTSKINFRISSLYPEIVDDEFCSVIADKRVRPHFHLSVQSGSDKILKLMNRVYDSNAVLTACEKLKKAKKNPFIACDIITGFPGETEEDFNQTFELCRKCNFTWIHAFPFSERPGTPACSLKNKVPQNISGERAKSLNDLAVKNKIDYINSYQNCIVDGILETVKASQIFDKKIKYHVVTENFLHCEVVSSEVLEQRKPVKIKIEKPLIDRIQKGGELEASAIFVK